MNRCSFCKGKVGQKAICHVHQWGEKVFIFKKVQLGFAPSVERRILDLRC